MKIRNVFIIMLCFFMTACIAQLQGTKSESEARNFMVRAAAYEKAKDLASVGGFAVSPRPSDVHSADP